MRARVGCERAPLRRAGVLRPRLPPVVMACLYFALRKKTAARAGTVAGFWPTAASRATTVEIQRTFNWISALVETTRHHGNVQGDNMNRHFIRSVRACTAAAAALCSVPAVLAQEAPAARSVTAGGLEEVTVTARRREEMLQDVPISVSAFSGEALESAGAIDITWLQQTTPNLTLQVARGSNSTLIAFIRGIGQQDPLWGFEPGVGLYVDDVYVARPQGAVLDIFDIERIEVLRGPQGTLYGRNTIGGAIKYVTRPLGDEARFDGRVNIGSYNQRDVIASMAAPVTDTFSVVDV